MSIPETQSSRLATSPLKTVGCIALLGVLLIGGCTSAPEAPPPIQARINNQTGQEIVDIQYRSCGQTQWRSLGAGAIKEGTAIQLVLPDTCVDLDAYWSKNRLAGSQRNIKRDFPFFWSLR